MQNHKIAHLGIRFLVCGIWTCCANSSIAEPAPMQLVHAPDLSIEGGPCRIGTHPSESTEAGLLLEHQPTEDSTVSSSYCGGDLYYLSKSSSLHFDDEAEAFVAVNLDESSQEESDCSLGLTDGGVDFVEVKSPAEEESWDSEAPYSGNWKIIRSGAFWGPVLTHSQKPKLLHEVPTLGPGEIKVLEERNYKNYDLIIYSGGIAGTQVGIEAMYAAIYVPHRNEIVGTYPFQYRAPKFSEQLSQPEWTLGDTTISISDLNGPKHEIIFVPSEEPTAGGLGISRSEMKLALMGSPIELEFLERNEQDGEELMVAIAEDFSITMQFVGAPNDLRRVSAMFDINPTSGELDASSLTVARTVLETTLQKWPGSMEWFLDAVSSGREDTLYSVGDTAIRVLNQSSFGLVTLGVEKGGIPQVLIALEFDEWDE